MLLPSYSQAKSRAKKKVMGVLDIYGFEVFEVFISCDCLSKLPHFDLCPLTSHLCIDQQF